VRQARWRVIDIRPGDDCQVVALAGCDASNIGTTRHVIAPFERIEISGDRRAVQIVTMNRWRSACHSLLCQREWPASILGAARAAIDLHPFQLEPALAILAGLGSRVLIADDVGLGKTIQAGLVMSELRARGAADRVLVLSPSGLRDQWARELGERFGIDAAVVDTREGRRMAATLPTGVNPWTTVPVAISSLDYVKRPEVLPSVCRSLWDLVVVDEAHAAAAGSERHAAVEALAANAAYVVLLTATPHNGDERTFRSLCDLGSLGDRLLVFRRTRREVALGAGRRVHRLLLMPTFEELRMHQTLTELTHAVRRDRSNLDRESVLVLTTLCKRAASSAFAMEHSVGRRRAVLSMTGQDAATQLLLPLDEGDGEFDAADEPPVAPARLMEDGASEQDFLARLAACARDAVPHQSKLHALGRLLRRLQRLGEPALVFTEYRDTLLHIRDTLCPGAALIHGGLTREERRLAVDAFTSGASTLLFATDAAGEGLNLHQRCRVVVNLELPWNPMRLEQRIGRVDRIGQSRRVHVFHLIARGTTEARVLDRLKARLRRAQADIEVPDPLGFEDVQDEQFAHDVIAEMPVIESQRSRSNVVLREGLAFPSLVEQATGEFRRLLAIRSLSMRRGGLPARDAAAVPHAVAAFTRRRQLRSCLAGRTLALLPSRFEDSLGRTIATRVTPIVFHTTMPLGRMSRHIAVQLAESLASLQIDSIDTSASSWQARATFQHHAFWDARLTREQAIAAKLLESRTAAVQRGLFDQRADRRYLEQAGIRQELQDGIAHRIAVTHRTRLVGVAHVRPLLLIVE
jgi:superfamily II DNA or RNA helicase